MREFINLALNGVAEPIPAIPQEIDPLRPFHAGISER